MKLEDILGYGICRQKIKIQNFDTKETIYEGANAKYKIDKDYILAYFKTENDYILFMVYEKESE